MDHIGAMEDCIWEASQKFIQGKTETNRPDLGSRISKPPTLQQVQMDRPNFSQFSMFQNVENFVVVDHIYAVDAKERWKVAISQILEVLSLHNGLLCCRDCHSSCAPSHINVF